MLLLKTFYVTLAATSVLILALLLSLLWMFL